jgi:hypothetical protein
MESLFQDFTIHTLAIITLIQPIAPCPRVCQCIVFDPLTNHIEEVHQEYREVQSGATEIVVCFVKECHEALVTWRISIFQESLGQQARQPNHYTH